MKYDFDDIVPREGTGCIKYDTRREVFGRGDVIPLWVADMDFRVLPCVEKALRRRMECPTYGYGIREEGFYNSTAGWVKRRGGWNIDNGWIDFTPGVVPGFAMAIRALSEPGDKVVIQPPVYHPFAHTIKANDRQLVNNPLILASSGRYEMDFDDLDRKLAGAKLLLFCNPHNPSGRVFTREELTRVGELCCKHDVNIISDEIHCDMVHKPNKHIHIASIDERFAARCVTLIAPSKTFNLAGLSTAVAITPSDTLRRKLRAEMDALHIGQGNVFGTVALQAAYDEGEEWLEQLTEYIGGNMALVDGFMREHLPQIKTRPSEGTYIMWLDMRNLGMEQKELNDFLINKAGVGLNDGEMFGVEGRGFMRINLATSRAVILKALEQIREAIAQSGR